MPTREEAGPGAGARRAGAGTRRSRRCCTRRLPRRSCGRCGSIAAFVADSALNWVAGRPNTRPLSSLQRREPTPSPRPRRFPSAHRFSNPYSADAAAPLRDDRRPDERREPSRSTTAIRTTGTSSSATPRPPSATRSGSTSAAAAGATCRTSGGGSSAWTASTSSFGNLVHAHENLQSIGCPADRYQLFQANGVDSATWRRPRVRLRDVDDRPAAHRGVLHPPPVSARVLPHHEAGRAALDPDGLRRGLREGRLLRQPLPRGEHELGARHARHGPGADPGAISSSSASSTSSTRSGRPSTTAIRTGSSPRRTSRRSRAPSASCAAAA